MKLLHFYGVAHRARSYSRGRRYFYWHCDCNCCSCKYQTDLEGHAGAVLMPNRYSRAASWSYWQHPKQVTPGNRYAAIGEQCLRVLSVILYHNVFSKQMTCAANHLYFSFDVPSFFRNFFCELQYVRGNSEH